MSMTASSIRNVFIVSRMRPSSLMANRYAAIISTCSTIMLPTILLVDDARLTEGD